MANNIEMLSRVARGLGTLCEDVVFVGGAVTELYANDPAADEIRPTLDVDCVVELSSRRAYYELETALRARGFVNDTTPHAPICRWLFEDIIVDMMPTEGNILGFSNRWYKSGVERRIEKRLPDQTMIYIFDLPYYIGAKFEALNGRGGSDLRLSHDFEDIIYVLNNVTDIKTQLSSVKDAELAQYVSEQFSRLRVNPNIAEAIECALPYGSADRTPYILNLLNQQ